MDCSLPGSSVLGISQARILRWVAFPFPGDLPDPGIERVSLMSPALAGVFFTTSVQGPCRVGTGESGLVLCGGMELRLPLELFKE